MTVATAGGAQTLQLRRTLPASPERVYRAWTEPETLARWFTPTSDHTAQVPLLEARVGGAYRLEVRHKDGALHTAIGVYRELVPWERLRFTWRWENKPQMPETVVTIELAPCAAGTELVLTQEHFVDVAERDDHVKGWTGCLDRLRQIL